MKLYEFASLRGPNFFIHGINPQDAWEKLVEREKDNGTIWRCHDIYMVAHHLTIGFINLNGVAYREIVQ